MTFQSILSFKLPSYNYVMLSCIFFSFIVGCATVVEEPAQTSERRREVISDSTDVKALDSDFTADEIRLNNEYERAMRLYESGQISAAKVLMVAVKSEAEKLNVELPDAFDHDFQHIISAEKIEDAEEAIQEELDEEEALQMFEDEIEKYSQEQDQQLDWEDMEEREPTSISIDDGDDEKALDVADLPDTEYDQPDFKLPGLLDPVLAEEKIMLDFNQVDIRIILETISDITGANFLVEGGVSGTVTLISSSEVKLADVFRVLESILDVHGWAAVPSDDVIKVLPRGDGVRRHIPTRVGKDPAEIPRNDRFATQVMQLEHVEVEEAARLIEPRMSPDGNLSAHQPSNTIFLTDISSNIYQIALMVNQIDLPRVEEELVIFPLKYASSRSMADKINNLIETFSNGSNPGWQTEINIFSDSRTNSIVAFAEPRIIQSVKKLIDRLDVPRPEESVNVHVVKLYNADAEEMVDSLSTTVAALTDHEDADPIHITADLPTNAIIIAASPQDFQVLQAVISDLDLVREQVLVELRIMEASQRAMRDIGFDWASMNRPSDDSLRGITGTDMGVRGDATPTQQGTVRLSDPGGMAAALVKGDRIGAMMIALEGSTYVDVLSTPHLLTSNHQPATIAVVENIPYVRESRILADEDRDVISTFDYRDVGIKLEMTPHVGAGGMVRMVIESEFSKVVDEGEGQLRTSKREATTTVSVESGETVVIGGLIQDDTVKVTKRVPFFGSIPVLGRLFRRETDDIEKTNLLIFITPHVLTSSRDLADMSSRKESEMKNGN